MNLTPTFILRLYVPLGPPILLVNFGHHSPATTISKFSFLTLRESHGASADFYGGKTQNYLQPCRDLSRMASEPDSGPFNAIAFFGGPALLESLCWPR